MVIAVVGLGSMGKRRIRLIKEMYPSYEIVGVDGREDRRLEAYDKFQIMCYEQLKDVTEPIDCVFVCTSPLSHNVIIHDALMRGCNVFTELNLVSDGYKENIELAKEKNIHLFLSSTFFYREEIKYIRNKISQARKWNYIYHIGQYLPDWHPWESYKDFFLGDKRTNGCREIMAIELPWLVGTFGKVMGLNVLSDKLTDLHIEYNDNYFLQLSHESGTKGCIIVDVVSPVAVRKFELYRENSYLAWSGTPETLCEYDPETKQLEIVRLKEETEHVEGYRAFVVENAYKNEIREFFDVVINRKQPLYGFEQDMEILNLIDSIGA